MYVHMYVCIDSRLLEVHIRCLCIVMCNCAGTGVRGGLNMPLVCLGSWQDKGHTFTWFTFTIGLAALKDPITPGVLVILSTKPIDWKRCELYDSPESPDGCEQEDSGCEEKLEGEEQEDSEGTDKGKFYDKQGAEMKHGVHWVRAIATGRQFAWDVARQGGQSVSLPRPRVYMTLMSVMSQ